MLTAPWLDLALFMTLLLALSLHGLAASGHFPGEHRAPTLRSPMGCLILFGSIATCIGCLAVALTFAWRALPWYMSVIGGGVALLAAPLVLRPFPDSFVDGRAALLVFSGAAAALALAMLYSF